jgi:hypothetical protein
MTKFIEQKKNNKENKKRNDQEWVCTRVYIYIYISYFYTHFVYKYIKICHRSTWAGCTNTARRNVSIEQMSADNKKINKKKNQNIINGSGFVCRWIFMFIFCKHRFLICSATLSTTCICTIRDPFKKHLYMMHSRVHTYLCGFVCAYIIYIICIPIRVLLCAKWLTPDDVITRRGTFV